MYRSQNGFTLIELLIIIAIIGILATIAISSFKSYRSRGFTAQVVSDVKNAATAEEAYFVGRNTYTPSVGDLLASGFNKNAKVNLTITTSTNGYIFTATHANCGSSSWTFDSLLDKKIQGGPCIP